jgi:hypothetical protein
MIVPAEVAMDAETFRKHLELRHIPAGDFGILGSFYPGRHFAHDRHVYATYHTHLHERYDYEHEHASPAEAG